MNTPREPQDGLKMMLWSLGYYAVTVSFFVMGMWAFTRGLAATGDFWLYVPYMVASGGTGVIFGKLTWQARREIRTCWRGHSFSEWMRKGYTREDGDFIPVVPPIQWRMCGRCAHVDMREGEPSFA